MRVSIMASPRARILRRGAGMLLVLALLASANPGAADATAPATPPAAPAAVNAEAAPSAAPTAAAADGSELVCKRVRETGSNIGKRVCRTRAQLDAEADAARGMLDQRNRMTNSPGGNEGG